MKKLSLLIVALLVVAAGNALAWDDSYDLPMYDYPGGTYHASGSWSGTPRAYVAVSVGVSDANTGSYAFAWMDDLNSSNVIGAYTEGPGTAGDHDTWSTDNVSYELEVHTGEGWYYVSLFAFAGVNWAQ